MIDIERLRDNPIFRLLDRYRKITGDRQIDDQEMRERDEAASRYATEDEQHLVDYCMDCIRTSSAARREIREIQAECYRVYKEKEPAPYAAKEAWQSRIILPRPYATVQFAASAIRRAFSPDFLSIEDETNFKSQQFWQKTMTRQLDTRRANFVVRFVDATTMSLAVGESMELKPRWIPNRGLYIDLVEPWKISRDPDATPRDPQSGLYWIHQEWQDFHQLKLGQKKGTYINIDAAFDTKSESDDNNPFMTVDAIAARKDQVWERSKFRKMGLVAEFWGTVLSPNGEMLLPRASYMVMGGRVIRSPRGVRFQSLRWPGVSFSPQPDLLQHGGRGLLEGVRSIWEAMCNLMCLHEDAMKWLVNPMTEINVDALVNPEDVRIHPGKRFLTRDSLNGQQSVRSVGRRDVTSSVLANMQYHDQNYQRGTSVTDSVQGLPGYRQDMTWRESEQNLSQAMEVFSLMGTNVELGAIQAISACRETVEAFAGWNDYSQLFSADELRSFGVEIGSGGQVVVPRLSGSFHVSGIQKLMRDAETVSTIKHTIIPLAGNPIFSPFIRPFSTLKSLELRTGLKDENILVSKEIGEQMQEQMFAQMTNGAAGGQQ